LLNDPELLVVDEPTAGLDPEERIRFRTLLSRLAERRTVVLSTHIVDDVAQTCTELAVLGRGRLIYRGTVSELTAHAEGSVPPSRPHSPDWTSPAEPSVGFNKGRSETGLSACGASNPSKLANAVDRIFGTPRRAQVHPLAVA
jgi:ABC-type multidrug transport system ATPase subunit